MTRRDIRFGTVLRATAGLLVMAVALERGSVWWCVNVDAGDYMTGFGMRIRLGRTWTVVE